MPSCRSVVLWAAFLLALSGWVGTLWSWLDHGVTTTDTAGFYVALAVAVTGTLSTAVTFVMPDQARIYADGYQDGMACSECPLREIVHSVPAVRHLSPVR